MRPRMLLVAYCCAPDVGSEPAVGWSLAQMASQTHDVTVLVEKWKFERLIVPWLRRHGDLKNVTFEFVPEKWWASPMWAFGLGPISYRWWHERALLHAQKIHADQKFDLVQMATIIWFREPGGWHRLGPPVVWGPIGGTHNFPKAFLSEAGFKGRLKESLRNVANTWQLLHSARVKRGLRLSTRVVAASRQIRDELRQSVDRPIDVISEISLPDCETHPTCRREITDGLRILWSGLFETRKCLSLLIKAVAEAGDVPVHVRVLGDGSERELWKRLAEEIGVADRFEWMGWVPGHIAKEQFAWADVFAFTSVRDTTGTVVLEAINAGLPVLGLNHQGIADAVRADCGILVTAENPRQTITELANAIRELSKDHLQREVLAHGAANRAKDYQYEAKRAMWETVWSAAVDSRPNVEDSDAIDASDTADSPAAEELPHG